MAEKDFFAKREKELLEDVSVLESYIKNLWGVLPLPVCITNSIFTILDTSQSFDVLFGYGKDELVGDFLDRIFVQKKDFEKLSQELSKKKRISDFETILKTSKGKEIFIRISAVARIDEKEGVASYLFSFVDITLVRKVERELKDKVKELQKYTQELKDSRAALLNILEDIEEASTLAIEEKNKTLAIITNFADGLLVFDKENKLSLINPKAEEFFELSAQKVIGQPILTFFKQSKITALEHLTKVLGKKIQKIFRKEVKIRENLILETSTVPVLKGKEKLGTLVILHDVTREKAIERMKTEFVSLAAHQLRTPLSAIKWTLRMLLDEDLGKISDEQRDFIEKTYTANERMINLINDLLDVTRIEEGRYLYKPASKQIENVVKFVLNSYKEEVEKRKLKLEFKEAKIKLPQAKIDVEKIQLAIQNLLDNAIRYTPAGGKVTVAIKYVKKEIEVCIKDTGIGIPKDQQSRVFSKFFRGANAIRMETEGSGLGLYITKNIIEAHGGRIWFESEAGKGTTFYFTLPAKEEFEEFIEEF